MSLGRLTSWCFRRRRLVVAWWIVALIGVTIISAVGGADSRVVALRWLPARAVDPDDAAALEPIDLDGITIETLESAA